MVGGLSIPIPSILLSAASFYASINMTYFPIEAHIRS